MAVMLVAAGGGIAWQYYEEEIRDLLGLLPSYAEQKAEDEKNRISPSGKKPRATDSVNEESLPSLSEETEIFKIVTKRYPEIDMTSFEVAFPSINQIPPSAFPDRVKTESPVNLKSLSDNGDTLGLSFIKAGGYIVPKSLEGSNRLIVNSLADRGLVASVPLAETDFLSVVAASYERAQENAMKRVREMREADTFAFQSNSRLYRALQDLDAIWEDSDDPKFKPVRESLDTVIGDQPFEAKGYHWIGQVSVDEPGHSGRFDVIIVLIEGPDQGFGPFPWRARCLMRSGRVIGWLGLPDALQKS